MDGLQKIENSGAITKKLLAVSLTGGSLAMEKSLTKGFKEERIKGFKPHASAFPGYLLAHEAHHS
jgi:hypothetical protein